MAVSGEHHISDHSGVADIFDKCYPDVISGIENVHLMKVDEIPE